MRVFIAALVLIFSVQSWTKADDINDFEIEGMSIGDSVLDFFTKYEIENALDTGGYKSDKFIYYFLEIKNSETYEYIQFHIKKNDKKYIIQAVEGHIMYLKDINKCYDKMNKVKLDLDKSFGFKGKRDKGKHPIDPTGKSTYSRIMYELQNQGYAEIICYDLSQELENGGQYDRFVISLGTSEILDWLTNEAYN